jgi:hypothetical protein
MALINPFALFPRKKRSGMHVRRWGSFLTPYSETYERQLLIYSARRNAAAIHDPVVAAKVIDILTKCAELDTGEVVSLSRDEKALISAAC